jgi:Tfp pilus assembly PilM family ATPase
MGIGNSLLVAVRRYAAGIDVGPHAVRIVVLSQRTRGRMPPRLEYLAAVPLAEGALAGAEIVERNAVVRALRTLLAGLPRALASQAPGCAMALPASATLVSRVPFARLATTGVEAGSPNALEAAVQGEAERIAGIERHALAVDWFVDGGGGDDVSLTIAAAARQHLEARIECAAAASITLTAVDGEAHAALRAMRLAASQELGQPRSYAALWIGAEGLFGWRIVEDAVAAEMRYPAPGYTDCAEALRALAGDDAPACALLGGELELLADMGVSVADLGDVLGCTVLPFECGALGEAADGLPEDLLHQPACVVAFGLALRGLIE